jgi:hypothetical protein
MLDVQQTNVVAFLDDGGFVHNDVDCIGKEVWAAAEAIQKESQEPDGYGYGVVQRGILEILEEEFEMAAVIRYSLDEYKSECQWEAAEYSMSDKDFVDWMRDYDPERLEEWMEDTENDTELVAARARDEWMYREPYIVDCDACGEPID